MGVLAGHGPPPSNTEVWQGTVSNEQVEYAMRILRPCWAVILESGRRFTIRPRRASPALCSAGLGYLCGTGADEGKILGVNAVSVDPSRRGTWKERCHLLRWEDDALRTTKAFVVPNEQDPGFDEITVNAYLDVLGLDQGWGAEGFAECYYSVPEDTFASVTICRFPNPLLCGAVGGMALPNAPVDNAAPTTSVVDTDADAP